MASVTGVTAPAALTLFFFRHPIAAWFSNDPAVATMAAEYLFYVSFLLVFYGLYFVALRTLQAAGDMNTPMLISVTLALLVGTPLGFGLSTYTDLGPTGMWIASLVYGVLNGTCDMLSATEAPISARTSASFSWSADRMKHATCVSFLNPSGKSGRIGRSI